MLKCGNFVLQLRYKSYKNQRIIKGGGYFEKTKIYYDDHHPWGDKF